MKPIQISYGRLRNLGNFSNHKAGITATLEEGEDPVVAIGQLEDLVRTALRMPSRAHDEAEVLLAQVHSLHHERNALARRVHGDAAREAKLRADGKEEAANTLAESVKALSAKLPELGAAIEAREAEEPVQAARALLKRPAPAAWSPSSDAGPEVPSDDDIPFDGGAAEEDEDEFDPDLDDLA